jgi:CheY-like chemotaxis protein
VVEDDYFIADDVCRTLEDQGANVLGPAPSVADALALLARGDRPDTALLDVKLGDEVVYPLADVLHEQGIPIIFVTAYRQKDLPEAYARTPRCEKPLDMRQLMRVLAR